MHPWQGSLLSFLARPGHDWRTLPRRMQLFTGCDADKACTAERFSSFSLQLPRPTLDCKAGAPPTVVNTAPQELPTLLLIWQWQ